MAGVTVQNWKGSIKYQARSVEMIRSAADLQRIAADPERYPSPVRAKGSHHSTTRCVVAEGGTVCDMTPMNRIININAQARTITMEAGVLLIDAAKALEACGLQFFVNGELGNLTMGSGATGGTKDASHFTSGEWECGQVASYCCSMKTVQPDGSILVASQNGDPELMAAMRSGYGMLGIAFEVTFRIKPISAMAMEHDLFHVDEFAARLPQLVAGDRSMMLYLFPFIDRVLVEYRADSSKKLEPGAWQWKLRNYTWKTVWPFIANLLSFLPVRSLRYGITNLLNRLTGWFMRNVLRADNSSPADQIIRYSERAGFASYTFSIWAFPRAEYAQTIKKYFSFCKEYHTRTGYRCDMLNVGYCLTSAPVGQI